MRTVSIRSGVPLAPAGKKRVRAAERAYLEALLTYGFDSPECAAAFVALRRARQAHCPSAASSQPPPDERAA